jgi:alkanesulfonate monooxygenase SsuD/methylene tetrahydromethanopterin reductase-like flavin-dependent oxidoreductase (luciferase family)
MAAMAHATTSIGLGSGIAYGFGRTPLVLAAEIRDLDELSGGRVVMGLGTGTQRMQRDWHGLDGEHAASRMEELVPLVRRLWHLDQGPVEHEGRFYRVSIQPTAPPRPVEREIPIYMAGVNPRMIEAAGAVADGLVGHPLFTRRYVEEVVRPALARGARRGGRPEAVPIAGYINCCVDEDRSAARREAATLIAFNASVSTYRGILRLHGFDANAAAIRSAWEERDWEGMVGAVSDEMIDTIALAGTAEEVRSRFESSWSDLYETPLLWPPVFRGVAGVEAITRAFAV